jgi:hypothetical protein
MFEGLVRMFELVEADSPLSRLILHPEPNVVSSIELSQDPDSESFALDRLVVGQVSPEFDIIFFLIELYSALLIEIFLAKFELGEVGVDLYVLLKIILDKLCETAAVVDAKLSYQRTLDQIMENDALLFDPEPVSVLLLLEGQKLVSLCFRSEQGLEIVLHVLVEGLPDDEPVAQVVGSQDFQSQFGPVSRFGGIHDS